MNELTIAKIQNTINEIENQLTKIYVDTPVFRVLMNRTVIQLNELMTHIGFLEGKLRIYEDKEIASQVEDNHAPSNWRKPHELNDD
jgi:hypothetical protein